MLVKSPKRSPNPQQCRGALYIESLYSVTFVAVASKCGWLAENGGYVHAGLKTQNTSILSNFLWGLIYCMLQRLLAMTGMTMQEKLMSVQGWKLQGMILSDKSTGVGRAGHDKHVAEQTLRDNEVTLID